MSNNFSDIEMVEPNIIPEGSADSVILGEQWKNQRRKYYMYEGNRPQGMLWSRNPGNVGRSGSDAGWQYPWGLEGKDFIITSDHNRGPFQIDSQRIENRARMINGNMRSYYVDDKFALSTSWTLLPSRAYNRKVYLNSFGPTETEGLVEYTADNGAGGVDMLEWYKDTTGPFWVFLSYDNFAQYRNNQYALNHMEQYSDRKLMYFSSFNYSVVRRGIYDMWDISVSLEEA